MYVVFVEGAEVKWGVVIQDRLELRIRVVLYILYHFWVVLLFLLVFAK